MSARLANATWLRLPLDHPDPDLELAAQEQVSSVRRRSRERRTRRESGEISGAVRIRHEGRDYCGWYRVAGDLLTVYCGVASNTGLLPELAPSPTPLAERLLRELLEAEHPGLNPA